MVNVTEHSIVNVPSLRAALITGIKVFHHDSVADIWYRVLHIAHDGRSRLLALLPCDHAFFFARNPTWRLSWDDAHRSGRIREDYVDLFNGHDRLTTKLPATVMSLLEHNDCLHLVDDTLFS